MRDAQSNFDQVISFSGDKITAADVTNALGFAGVEILKNSINAIADREPRAVLAVVDDLIARGHDLRNFCRDLLGLFRDLLVFKVAGEDKHLFEGAVFSETRCERWQRRLARPIWYVSSTHCARPRPAFARPPIRDTSSRSALVKLIEMRSVAGIESILERLDAISSGIPLPARPAPESRSAAASGDAPTEKKTLKAELSAAIREIVAELPDELIGTESLGPEMPAREAPVIAATPVFAAPIAYPVRLPPLSSAELEHADDARLDDAYDERLVLSGDDLMPIPGVEKLVEAFTGRVAASMPATAAGNGSAAAGTAAARAFSPAVASNPSTTADAVDLPKLE